MKYDAVGIGNPMLDILVKVDEKVIEEFGLTKGMFNLVSHDQSRDILSKISKYGFEIEAGDATANSLASLANLGCKTALVGKIGDDENGNIYIKKSEEGGIHSLISKNKEVPTGSVICLVTADSERTFATYLGASLTLTPEDLPADEFVQSKFVCITGYQLDDPGLRKVAMKGLELAKKNGIKISIDLADKGVISRNPELLKDIVKNYADVLFVNEEEGEVFTGVSDFEEMIKIMAPLVETVCLKIGSEGSYISHDGEIYRIKSVKVKAVDTTGAGDSYASGIIYGLMNDLPVPIMGKIASIISSHIVSKMGARPGVSLYSLFDDEIKKAIEK